MEIVIQGSKVFCNIPNIIHGTIDGTHYLLRDKGYPLLSQWLMMHHRKGEHNFSESLYNKMHKRGRSIVKSEFGIFEKTYHELQWQDRDSH
jgi:hypothetical protein